MQNRNRKANGQIISENVGDINGTYFTYLRAKAKERNLEFSVSKEYLWNLFLKQNKKCALSGVDLVISNKLIGTNTSGKRIDRTEHTASLDRIDNTKGYVENNLQWVHKILNGMRRQYSIEEYIKWCTLVANHANIEPISMNEVKVVEQVQRLESEDSTNKLSTSAGPHIIVGEDIV